MTQETRLSTSEACRRAGLSPATLRRYVKIGKLQADILPSGHLRFRPEDIDGLYQPAAMGKRSETAGAGS